MAKKKVEGRSDILSTGRDNIIISSTGTLKWNSDYNLMGRKIKLRNLVEEGLKSSQKDTKDLAKMIETDLKGKGLFIGFPIVMLAVKLNAEGKLRKVI